MCLFGKKFLVMLLLFCENFCEKKSAWKCLNIENCCLNNNNKHPDVYNFFNHLDGRKGHTNVRYEVFFFFFLKISMLDTEMSVPQRNLNSFIIVRLPLAIANIQGFSSGF